MVLTDVRLQEMVAGLDCNVPVCSPDQRRSGDVSYWQTTSPPG